MKAGRILKPAPWAGIALILASCSHDMRAMQIDEQIGGYGAAVRWGMFQRALEYQAHPPTTALDFNALRNIQVTGYEPVFRKDADEGNTLYQTVLIRYVHLDQLVEKNLVDEQKWHYNDDRNRWLLETGLPRFK